MEEWGWGADEFDGGIIEERDHVPEYIAICCLEQETSLADAELLSVINQLLAYMDGTRMCAAPLAPSKWTIPEDRPSRVATCSYGFS